jgi:hypothetical protein
MIRNGGKATMKSSLLFLLPLSGLSAVLERYPRGRIAGEMGPGSNQERIKP